MVATLARSIEDRYDQVSTYLHYIQYLHIYTAGTARTPRSPSWWVSWW